MGSDGQPKASNWQVLRFVCVLGELAPQIDTQTQASAMIEAIEAVLFDAGALAVTLLDAKDHPLTEPKPGELPLWPEVVVEALFGADHAIASVIDRLRAEKLIRADTPVATKTMADQVWTRAWMDDFKPMAFGQRLWICPSHSTPDPEWPVVVTLDPGLAFGSGTHPTTALCLQWLDGWAQHHAGALSSYRLLDFGCGSGILAVAAAKLGVSSIVAVDHDPQALIATHENALLNGVSASIEVQSPEAFFESQGGTTFDVVMANILVPPLIELAPKLMSLVGPGGHLVLSGILNNQAQAIKEAYRDLDACPDQAHQEDWVRLAFAHNAHSHYN